MAQKRHIIFAFICGSGVNIQSMKRLNRNIQGIRSNSVSQGLIPIPFYFVSSERFISVLSIRLGTVIRLLLGKESECYMYNLKTQEWV